MSGRDKQSSPSRDTDANLVQSLSRALLLLETLSHHEDGCRLRDLCRLTGLSPSTAHRLLTTMQQRRFVAFEQDGAVWHVGGKCLTVGAVFLRRRNFLPDAVNRMEHLSKSLGETVNLGVLDDDHQVLLLRQTSCGRLRIAPKPAGSRLPGHASGIGKVLLAQRAPGERDAILGGGRLARFTDRTIVGAERLARELDAVSADGFALDDEETEIGKRCIAVPIFDEVGGCVAAVSVSSQKARLPDGAVRRVVETLAAVAAEITGGAGGYLPAGPLATER